MSLLRLLATGKSLVGLKQSNQRYHVSRERLLPQFSAKENPFRTTGDTVPTPSTTVEATCSPPQESTGEQVASGTVDCCARSQEDRPPENRGTGTKTVGRKLADWTGGSLAKLRTLVPSRRVKPPKAAIPAFAKPLVQGELSLERVKVVRNDLSDSDLDVVRCKPEAAAANTRLPVKEQPQAEPGGGGWARVTGGLIGTGKS